MKHIFKIKRVEVNDSCGVLSSGGEIGSTGLSDIGDGLKEI